MPEGPLKLEERKRHLNFDQMHLKSTVLDNPGFTVLLVRTSMGARE